MSQPRSEHIVLHRLLERNAAEVPDAICANFEDGSVWTWLDALHATYAAAEALRKNGLQQGDPVLVVLPNGPGFLRTWWGAAALGCPIIPMNPAYRGALIEHIISLGQPTVIVRDEEFAKKLTHVALDPRIVQIGAGELDGMQATPVTPGREIQPWDALALATTSGTTGPSKLVRMTHAHCLAAGQSVLTNWGATSDDTCLMDVPMIHVSSLYVVHGSLAHRARLAIRTRPALDDYWEVARDTGATFSQLYGSMASYLESKPPRAAEREHRLRVITTIPLPADPERFKNRFGVRNLHVGWGSTEAPGLTASTPGHPATPGSCGVAMPGIEIRLVDENDIEVIDGEIGEAIVRSDTPWLFTTEYVGNPEATARAWRNGWFHTGDLLRRDERGRYYFVDRGKDALRRRGQNISSFDVEGVISQYPPVAEAACVPERADVDVEDEVKVWILPSTDDPIDFEDLLRFCAERLPHYMVPRYFEVASEFPKTAAGKVQKHQLRERGSGPTTWDRIAHGLDVTRHGVVRTRTSTATLLRIASSLSS